MASGEPVDWRGEYRRELARANAAEATGRAAVRALEEICSAVRWPEIASVYPRWASRVDAVLATDTARAWLEEGRDD